MVDAKSNNEKTIDVLIIGSGPTGLTAAVECLRLGLTTRIIDRKAQRSTHDSRALVVHPRVMELLDIPNTNHRVIKSLQEGGFEVEGFHIYLGDSKEAISNKMNKEEFGDTTFQYIQALPQYNTEATLEEEVGRLGGKVEYGWTITSLDQDNEIVKSTISKVNPESSSSSNNNNNTSEEEEETIQARYVIGCDGGRSKTRDLLNIQMHRQHSKFYFIIADVSISKDASGLLPPKQASVFWHSTGPLALLPLPHSGEFRLAGLAPNGITTENTSNEALDSEFLTHLIRQRTDDPSLECTVGRWATIFEISHGMSDTFRQKRVFLAGDASHVHSPVGGQGMNYGMQDSINLVWKLAWVERFQRKKRSSINNSKENTNNGIKDDSCRKITEEEAQSIEAILDSYNVERMALGQKLLQNVERATWLIATQQRWIQMLRNFAVRILGKHLMKGRGRAMGQLNLRYHAESSTILVEKSREGEEDFLCEPGERLPNLYLVGGKQRLYEQIGRVRHTWVLLNAKKTRSSSSSSSSDTSDKESEKRQKHKSDQKEEVGPGGIPLIRAIPLEEQDTPPEIPLNALFTTQAILVRPDLYVAAVGRTVEEAFDTMKKVIPSEDVLAEM